MSNADVQKRCLKMQQLKKHQFLKTVALVHDSVHAIRDVCRKANSSVNEAVQC